MSRNANLEALGSRTTLASRRTSGIDARLSALLVAFGAEVEAAAPLLDSLGRAFDLIEARDFWEAKRCLSTLRVDVILVAASCDSSSIAALRELSEASSSRHCAIVLVFGTLAEFEAHEHVSSSVSDVWTSFPCARLAPLRVASLVREARLGAVEAELVEERQKLVEAIRFRSEFFATMSHELRTPLNAIIGFSEMMRDGLAGPLAPRQQDFVAHIFRAGAHLMALIEDILDLTRIDSGRARLELGVVDFDELIDLAIADSVANGKTSGVDVVRDPIAESVRFACDERRVRHILSALVKNGIASAREGSSVVVGVCVVRLEAISAARFGAATELEESEFEVFVELTVEHEGRGLSSDELENLWDPSLGGERLATNVNAAPSLALALVGRVARLHGGAAAVMSDPAFGSRFYVFLPLRIGGIAR